MNKKAYLVLSVKEIRRMLRVAERSQKVNRSKPTHCIVLRDLEIIPFKGEIQISSCDVHSALVAVERDTDRTERIASHVAAIKAEANA